VSFSASDNSGQTVVVDGSYVEARVGDLAANVDLSRYIL
jgi:ATP-dependent HslUV protease ATP-binding subunit HslU